MHIFDLFNFASVGFIFLIKPISIRFRPSFIAMDIISYYFGIMNDSMLLSRLKKFIIFGKPKLSLVKDFRLKSLQCPFNFFGKNFTKTKFRNFTKLF